MKKLLPILLVALATQFTHLLAAQERPNILWLFSDDHAYQAIGAYGGRLQSINLTPNIDRIAKEGMRFDKCYVANSICAPSRATLLTGKHSHLNGKIDNIGGFDHDQQQFQKILQKNGYQTAMIGKIHLSGAMQGFDIGKYYRDRVRIGIRPLLRLREKPSIKINTRPTSLQNVL